MTIKISQLPELTVLHGNTIIPVVDTIGPYNTSKRITGVTLQNFFANVATSAQSADLTFNSNLVPIVDALYDIGGFGKAFGNAFIGGRIYSSSTVQSSSTETGAVILYGGMGVGGNINAGNVNSMLMQGTIISSAQPYITSVGNLTSLNVTGTIETTGIVYGNTGVSGRLLTAAQPNITSVGNLISLTVAGVVRSGGIFYANAGISGTVANLSGINSSGNISTSAYFTGNGSLLTGIINFSSLPGYGGNVGGTVSTASQPYITSIGTLSSLTVSGSITSTNILYANAGIGVGASVTAIINTGTNGVGNIGSPVSGFNTVFAKATTAQYADLAEYYLADTDYETGTVLEFGGEFEVTLASNATRRVAGVVSSEPAYVMNTQLKGKHVVAIALQGRVPCKVRGTIEKGDMLISSGDGYACADSDPKNGTIIGKSLENFNGDSGIIEVVVGRL